MQPQHKKAIILAVTGLALLLVGYAVGKNLENWVDQRDGKEKTTTEQKEEAGYSNSLKIPESNEAVEQWKDYTNSAYGYSFKYPSEFELGSGPHEDITKVGEVYTSNLFTVEVLPVPDGDFPEALNASKLPLPEFAQKLWEAQKSDENLTVTKSDLNKTTVGGSDAYTFELNGGFLNFDLGGYVLDYKARYYILEGRGARLIIHYPVDNQTALKMLQTFQISK
jgi:hypothetical protein